MHNASVEKRNHDSKYCNNCELKAGINCILATFGFHNLPYFCVIVWWALLWNCQFICTWWGVKNKIYSENETVCWVRFTVLFSFHGNWKRAQYIHYTHNWTVFKLKKTELIRHCYKLETLVISVSLTFGLIYLIPFCTWLIVPSSGRYELLLCCWVCV